LNIIDEPREIINRIEGVEFREPKPEQCGKWSTCCGGGGLELSHAEFSGTLGKNRLQELLATGADVIATSCPACLMQLHKEAKRVKARVTVMDLAQILDEALM
jgi:Fe-S oxidoreductase